MLTRPKGLAMAKSEANWVEIDPSTLDESLRTAYELYKAAYKEMKTLRQAFEADMDSAAELPQGKRMIFGYNFGKLSVAVVDDDRRPARPRATTQSLADFLAGQAASGGRA